MSAVIYAPDFRHLQAARQAVRTRAANLGATAESTKQALSVLFHEMQAGRSTAASVALANGSLRGQALPHRGYPTPPGAA